MKPFNVIIPIDFSQASLKAVEAALALQKRHPDMQITLLHVVEPVPTLADPMVVASINLPEIADSCRDKLDELGQKLNWTHEVTVHRRVEIGHPWQTICRIAKEEMADFIVLATHGRTGLARLFMGSVAENVVRHAPCPVMVIHTYQEPPTEAETVK